MKRTARAARAALWLVFPALLSCSAHALGRGPAPAAPAQAPDPAPRAAAFDHEHRLWTALLAEHVKGDRVDYRGLRGEREKLDAYLSALAGVRPEDLAGWSEDERFAYWINVYNAFCVQLVVESYPVESIRDLGGALFGKVWDKEFIPLPSLHPHGDGEPLSLNDVEHEILRARFPDARLHAAVNCASVSCPPLLNEAYVAERLNEQLDEQMRAFLADPRRNELDRAAGRLRLSAIFDWFEEDFERDAGGVRAFVARFAPGPDTGWIGEAEVEYLDYDWSLNDV